MNSLVKCLQPVSFLLCGYVFTNAMSPTIFSQPAFLTALSSFRFLLHIIWIYCAIVCLNTIKLELLLLFSFYKYTSYSNYSCWPTYYSYLINKTLYNIDYPRQNITNTLKILVLKGGSLTITRASRLFYWYRCSHSN